MSVPIPSVLAVSWAMASASPVTILTFTPICRGGGDGRLGVVAWRVEQGQHAEELPRAVPLGPGHAQRAEAARRELARPPVSTAAFTCPALADSSRITCGAPLVTLNVVPSAALTVASVRLRTGSNGWKWTTS